MPIFSSCSHRAICVPSAGSGSSTTQSVRTNTLQGPGGDAAIVRIKETGTSVAMSVDGNGRYCALSPREGARLLVAECCRNLSAVGALPVAATNNLNFGNPERPEIMAQLVEAIEGISEACKHFETPITGGNVSLYNETLGEAIWPTPVMGIVGLMKTAPPVTIPFKEEGRTVMLLGGLGSVDATRFGGTQYAKVVLNKMWGLPPALDMDYEKRVHTAIREVIAQGLAESSHDVGDGGLAVALAECCARRHRRVDFARDRTCGRNSRCFTKGRPESCYPPALPRPSKRSHEKTMSSAFVWALQ